MSEITVIFPAAVFCFVLLVMSEYRRASRLPRRSGAGAERRFAMDARDHLFAWGAALLYGAVAFTMLGDADAPESFSRPTAGEALEIVLPEEAELGSFRWFAGLGTGQWTVEISPDGENWSVAAVLDQNYVALLRWNEQAPAEAPARARYLRVFSSGGPEMGELALYDAAGRRLPVLSCSENAAALFDEPEMVPAQISFLNGSYFDEIYHARTAWEGLRGEGIYETTHPPLGKELLSLGILLFGMNPFGWRFMGTLLGTLMLPVLYAFVKRLFGRRDAALGCALIFAFDFMHFTQTRIATIDTYGVFFLLLMYYFMYRFVSAGETGHALRHLALSGLFFGLGAASKWTCLYAGAGLGVIWLLYWIGELRRPDRPDRFRAFFKNVLWCLLFFVAVPALIYYLSYWPYGRAAGLSWPGMYFQREYPGLVLSNQEYMFRYHSGLVATHPCSSHWWQWVLDARPILYYLEYLPGNAKATIAAFTSPLLCWGGIIALLCTAWRAVSRRDERAVFITVGFLAQLLPWVAVPRLTFAYHYFPSEVFLLLALGYVFSEILEKSGRRWPLLSFTALAGGLFAAFYPVLSGLPVSRSYCDLFLRWMTSWPI